MNCILINFVFALIFFKHMRVHILIVTCIFNYKIWTWASMVWLSKSNKEILTEKTGKTCLVLQDGVPDPAAVHTGRRADPKLSEGKEPDDERPGHGMCPWDAAFPNSKATSTETAWAGTSFPWQWHLSSFFHWIPWKNHCFTKLIIPPLE